MANDAQIMERDAPADASAVTRTLDRMLETVAKAVAKGLFNDDVAPSERSRTSNKVREPPTPGKQIY